MNKRGKLNCSSYNRTPLRSSASTNIQNIDKYCFIWSVLACLHPCENDHHNRVSSYKQYFNGLNNGFDFTNGFKSSDMHRFEKLNKLSNNKIELNFYQDKDKRKHNLIPIEISKNESDRVVDLLKYKNHWPLIKNKNVILKDHKNNLYVDKSWLHIQMKTLY